MTSKIYGYYVQIVIHKPKLMEVNEELNQINL